MAMDKDTLVKHKFWVMLAVAAPLALGAIFLLLTVVSSSVAAIRKANEDAVKNIRPPNDAKNDENVKVKKSEAEKVIETKDKAWAKAWSEQEKFFTWPKGFDEMGIDFQTGRFITDVKVVKDLPAKIEEKNKVAGIVERADLQGNYVTLQGAKKQTFHRTATVTFADERGDRDKVDRIDKLKNGDRVVLTLQTARYFDEPLTTVERDNYPKKATRLADDRFYYSQIDSIITQVTPVNDKGKGIVWLGNWAYKEGRLPPPGSRFFHFVPPEWDTDHDI